MALDLSFLDVPDALSGAPLLLNICDIDEDPDNPRTRFADLDGLAEDVKVRGILQPIVVAPAVDGRYRIRFGARRFRSAKLAGLTQIPVVISADPRQLDDYAQVSENRQRSELTPLEEAAFIKKRLDAGDKRKAIASGMHVSASTLTTLSALIDPPAFVLALYHSGKCTNPDHLYRLRTLHSTHPESVIDKTQAATEITRSFIDELTAQMSAEATSIEPLVPVSETSAVAGGPTGEMSVDAIRTSKRLFQRIMIKHKGRTAQLMLDRSCDTDGSGWIQYQDSAQECEAVLTECTLEALLKQ